MATIDRKYIWPIMDTQAVCLTQNVLANNSLILNGNLVNSFLPNQISFIKAGFIRTVSITSVNNLSGATFTVIGIQNGTPVTENITGPNNTTVYGNLAFDVINSITVNQNSNGVQIGTGKKGYLPSIEINLLSNTALLPIFAIQSIPTNITVDLGQTLDDIYNNGSSLDTIWSGDSIIKIENAQTDPFIFSGINITKYLSVHIADSGGLNSALTVIYLQA